MKNLSIIVTIATLLVSMGISFGITQAKVGDIDRMKERTEDVDRRTVKLESNLDAISGNLLAQKEDLREQKAMTKEILSILLKEKTPH